MPRRPRDDREPEIEIPDTRESQRQVNQVLRNDERARVKRLDRERKEGFHIQYDELERRLIDCRGRDVKIDEGLLAFMMRRIQTARVRQLNAADGTPLKRRGNLVYSLVQVGCRVEMRQEDISDAYGCSRTHVIEQIALLKEECFIGNWGHGWYEFDASLCWRGDHVIREAYIDQQLLHASLRRTSIIDARCTGPRGQGEEDADGKTGA